MQIAAVIISLAVLMCVEAASAQTTYRLSVSRHDAVADLSDADVKRILSRASKMLQRNTGFACNVTFKLKGPIRTFASPDGPIVNRDNIDAVHLVDADVTGVDFHVKLVKEIHFCRPDLPNPDGPFEGCSYSPPDFRSMILVHPNLHTAPKYPDHLLWPHEFGHLTGLGHRRDPFGHDRRALMTPCSLAEFAGLPATRVRVNRRECRRLLSGPGAQAAEAFGCPSGI